MPRVPCATSSMTTPTTSWPWWRRTASLSCCGRCVSRTMNFAKMSQVAQPHQPVPSFLGPHGCSYVSGASPRPTGPCPQGSSALLQLVILQVTLSLSLVGLLGEVHMLGRTWELLLTTASTPPARDPVEPILQRPPEGPPGPRHTGAAHRPGAEPPLWGRRATPHPTECL